MSKTRFWAFTWFRSCCVTFIIVSILRPTLGRQWFGTASPAPDGPESRPSRPRHREDNQQSGRIRLETGKVEALTPLRPLSLHPRSFEFISRFAGRVGGRSERFPRHRASARSSRAIHPCTDSNSSNPLHWSVIQIIHRRPKILLSSG